MNTDCKGRANALPFLFHLIQTKMARIIYSALVSTINGSIGGTTFQRNAFGNTAKKKSHQVRKNTTNQSIIKKQLVQMSTLWQALNSSQRTSWATYANSYPQFTRLNPTAQLNGRSVFMKRNCFIKGQIGSALYVPSSNAQLMLPSNILTVYQDTSNSNHLTVLGSDAPTGAAYTYQYFVSGTVSPTKFMSDTLTRAMNFDNSTHASLEDPMDIDSVYTSTFGARPAVGSTVLISCNIVNNANGQCLTIPLQKVTVQSI